MLACSLYSLATEWRKRGARGLQSGRVTDSYKSEEKYFWQRLIDWLIEQCFTSPPTQYRLYGRRFLQVKRPNQQYQSTGGTNSTQKNQTYNKQTWTQNTANPQVYNNMGWLGDGSHRGQRCQAWTAVGLQQGVCGRNGLVGFCILQQLHWRIASDAFTIHCNSLMKRSHPT